MKDPGKSGVVVVEVVEVVPVPVSLAEEGHLVRQDLSIKLADLKGENVNDYMLVMRSLSAFMWLRLLGSGWPAWFDETDAAYLVKPFTNPIANRELAVHIEAYYAEAAREAAEDAMTPDELRDFACGMLKRAGNGECLLCGDTRRLPLVILVKDWPATTATALAMADALRDADAAAAADDEEAELSLLLEEPYCERALSAEELADDPVQAMRILSIWVWANLLKNSWQSWIDAADMDRIIQPLISSIGDEEVRACLNGLYQMVISQIAQANVMGCLDQWDLQHDMSLKAAKRECLLCGGYRVR